MAFFRLGFLSTGLSFNKTVSLTTKYFLFVEIEQTLLSSTQIKTIIYV